MFYRVIFFVWIFGVIGCREVNRDESSKYPKIGWRGFYNVRPLWYASEYDNDSADGYFCIHSGELPPPLFAEVDEIATFFEGLKSSFPLNYTVEFDDRSALLSFTESKDLSEFNIYMIQSKLKAQFPFWRIVLDNSRDTALYIYPTAIVTSMDAPLEDVLGQIRLGHEDHLDRTDRLERRQMQWAGKLCKQHGLAGPAVVCVFNRNSLDDNFSVWVLDHPDFNVSYYPVEMPFFEGVMTTGFLHEGFVLTEHEDFFENEAKLPRLVAQVHCFSFRKDGFNFKIPVLDLETKKMSEIDFSHLPILDDRELPSIETK